MSHSVKASEMMVSAKLSVTLVPMELSLVEEGLM